LPLLIYSNNEYSVNLTNLGDYNIDIYTLNGKLIKNVFIGTIDNQTLLNLNTNSLVSGVDYVSIKYNNKQSFLKLSVIK
jgi:hypothetical protein